MVLLLLVLFPLLAILTRASRSRLASTKARTRTLHSAAVCHKGMQSVINANERGVSLLFVPLAAIARNLQLRIEDFVDDCTIFRDIEGRVADIPSL